MRTLFIIYLFSIIYGYGILAKANETVNDTIKHSNHDSNRNEIVKEIVLKITNLTLDSLREASSQEKAQLLIKIKEKLKKTAGYLGLNDNNYINTIMQDVRTLDFNDFDIGLRTADKNPTHINLKDDKLVKEKIIKSVANKIEILAKKLFHSAKTPEDMQKYLENIKLKALEYAREKQKISGNKNHTIKSYSDLILQGIELALRRNVTNDKRRMNIEFIGNNPDIAARKVEVEDDVNVYSDSEIKEQDNINIESTSDINLIMTPSMEINACGCECLLEKTCSKIKSLNNVTCRYGSSIVIPLEQLCDGIKNCPDGSDEEHCVKKAVKIVRNAARAISKIEAILPKNCYKTNIEHSILTTQNSVLQHVLETQLKFIKKYTYMNTSILFNADDNKSFENKIKAVVNEVATIVGTVGVALEGAVCTYSKELNSDVIYRKYSDLLDDDLNDLLDSRWSPKSCIFHGEYCNNVTYNDACKRICWQKDSLGRWDCEAVNKNFSVSLDFICDGKLDCYDETDENGCVMGSSLAKFEASNIYDNILQILTTKTASKEYASVRNKFISLHAAVKKLQKFSMKTNIDVLTVKNVRDECFALLTAIYEGIVKKASSMNEVDEVYLFLLSLNEKIVSAMKRSQTGNERVLAPDGCYCTNSRCAMPRCSKRCIRACSIEPKLTKYLCEGPTQNVSVFIGSICNGKTDCPNGDDERHCNNKEVCRGHHFVVLQHSLQDVGERQKGTALGEALKSWKVKVTATIKVVEKNRRPTPKILRNVITNILHDLVMAYASLDDSRRSINDYVITEFFKWSQHVIETLRSCGK